MSLIQSCRSYGAYLKWNFAIKSLLSLLITSRPLVCLLGMGTLKKTSVKVSMLCFPVSFRYLFWITGCPFFILLLYTDPGSQDRYFWSLNSPRPAFFFLSSFKECIGSVTGIGIPSEAPIWLEHEHSKMMHILNVSLCFTSMFQE